MGRIYFVQVLDKHILIKLGLDIGLQLGLDLSWQVFNADESQNLDVLVEELLVFEKIGVECHCLNEVQDVFRNLVEALLENSRVVYELSCLPEKLLGVFTFFSWRNLEQLEDFNSLAFKVGKLIPVSVFNIFKSVQNVVFDKEGCPGGNFLKFDSFTNI